MSQFAPEPLRDEGAEESLLGAIMLNPAMFDSVVEHVDAADFYAESHGRIFAAMHRLNDRGAGMEVIQVVAELRRAGELHLIPGGEDRVFELASIVPAASNAPHWAKIVREMAGRRSVLDAVSRIENLARSVRQSSATTSAEDLYAQAQQIIWQAISQRMTSQFEPLGELYAAEYDRIVELYESGATVVGTPTGFNTLDTMLGGMKGGQLIVLAARPSQGKSALALGIAANLTLRLGRDVAMFSLEMSPSELVQRIMGIEARVDVKRLQNGRLNPDEWTRLAHLGDKAGQLAHQLVIDDNPSVTLADMRAKLKRAKQERPHLALAIVDYLQLMTQGAKIEQRVQEVSQISRGLKVLAREVDIPIMALSQLNRGPEHRPDHRPLLSDLRESGSIEQDADVVLFIYRDVMYHPDTEEPLVAEIICAKNRNGPTGLEKMAFQKTWTRFGELAV